MKTYEITCYQFDGQGYNNSCDVYDRVIDQDEWEMQRDEYKDDDGVYEYTAFYQLNPVESFRTNVKYIF